MIANKNTVYLKRGMPYLYYKDRGSFEPRSIKNNYSVIVTTIIKDFANKIQKFLHLFCFAVLMVAIPPLCFHYITFLQIFQAFRVRITRDGVYIICNLLRYNKQLSVSSRKLSRYGAHRVIDTVNDKAASENRQDHRKRHDSIGKERKNTLLYKEPVVSPSVNCISKISPYEYHKDSDKLVPYLLEIKNDPSE